MSIHILGISGSLRDASFNTASLRVAQSEAPEGVSISLADLSGIPAYDQDLRDQQVPDAVVQLAERVRTADALLFATPEYNYSVPGVLKNAIDWLSRLDPQPLAGKPAAVMSASMSTFGGVRAQYDLRRIGIYLDLHFLNKPEVMIAQAQNKFEGGKLKDEDTRLMIGKLVSALHQWAGQIGPH